MLNLSEKEMFDLTFIKCENQHWIKWFQYTFTNWSYISYMPETGIWFYDLSDNDWTIELNIKWLNDLNSAMRIFNT